MICGGVADDPLVELVYTWFSLWNWSFSWGYFFFSLLQIFALVLFIIILFLVQKSVKTIPSHLHALNISVSVIYSKEYSVILTTTFYDMNQIISKISVHSNFTYVICMIMLFHCSMLDYCPVLCWIESHRWE